MKLAYQDLAPRPFRALLDLSAAVQGGLLGRKLVDLVFLRVSQIHGCAFCIDMHWRDLAAQGEDPRRLNSVAGWRESPFLEPRERAALHFAELVSAIPERAPDIAEVRAHFSDAELVELAFVVVTIQAWNRLNVTFHTPVQA